MTLFSRLAALALALFLLVTPALAQPKVEFGGYEWMIRTYDGGPGPNLWDVNNVFVDADGLHLRVQKANGKWTSAQAVMLGPSLGFGTYEFQVTGRLDQLDQNIVLGLFNFAESLDVGPWGTHEIDIEFAIWGQPNYRNRLNWTVYPAELGPKPTENHVPYDFTGTASTHRFEWTPDKVIYSSFAGYDPAPSAVPLAQWENAPPDPRRQIPQVPLQVNMNLWQLDGKAPANGEAAEVIIRSFKYTPLP